ncbi:hypothetical protein HNQ59_001801 [Chitinivorax tropicus]|uniref:2-oxoadipate dioxygenase/decarboxylase n=1 Tax=Chitinivorax tropicus TaxID=714531 RepID=A0A840MP39_9PROT|nr:DUF1338 domain-containing protein [Chitinivorax tropicus]MBB5018512.1 hypothetical protein [Chitinivorax tropicus]
MNLNTFYQLLWQDYVRMAPQAEQIHALFKADNPEVYNDHVAFRTFNRAPINLARLEQHFFKLGYRRLEPYIFEEKKLSAWGYVHDDPKQPRIFLSELLVEQLSPTAQGIIDKMCRQIDEGIADMIDVFWSGPLWEMPSWDEYQTLLAESEYAAWLAAIGMRVNHFTISVDHLVRPTTLAEVIDRVEHAGFAINSAGGKIKGTATQLLEQGSTLADRMPVTFGDGSVHTIPTCYYEFAKRYPDADGQLYQGFIAASADKIFESTNVNVAGVAAGS